ASLAKYGSAVLLAFSSASDISRMLSGSKACPARYGRIGMIALHRCRIRREAHFVSQCLSVTDAPGLLACFSVGDGLNTPRRTLHPSAFRRIASYRFPCVLRMTILNLQAPQV